MKIAVATGIIKIDDKLIKSLSNTNHTIVNALFRKNLIKEDYDVIIFCRYLRGKDNEPELVTKNLLLKLKEQNKRVIYIISEDDEIIEDLLRMSYYDIIQGDWKPSDIITLIERPNDFNDVKHLFVSKPVSEKDLMEDEDLKTIETTQEGTKKTRKWFGRKEKAAKKEKAGTNLDQNPKLEEDYLEEKEIIEEIAEEINEKKPQEEPNIEALAINVAEPKVIKKERAVINSTAIDSVHQEVLPVNQDNIQEKVIVVKEEPKVEAVKTEAVKEKNEVAGEPLNEVETARFRTIEDETDEEEINQTRRKKKIFSKQEAKKQPIEKEALKSAPQAASNEGLSEFLSEQRMRRETDLNTSIPRHQYLKLPEKMSFKIAFVGTNERVGTTHSAIMTAKYFANGRHKVAVINLSSNIKSYEFMEKYTNGKISNKDSFKYGGVHLFKRVTDSEVTQINDGYQIVIYDLGTDIRRSNLNLNAMSFADRKVVVFDGGLHNLNDLVFFANNHRDYKKYMYVSNTVYPTNLSYLREFLENEQVFKFPYNQRMFEIDINKAEDIKRIIYDQRMGM